jgi:LacI family transcriptional regulator
LRNQSDISPETRERVLQRVRELNYQPNFAARSLATGRTYSIGLIVPSLLHSFFAEVAKGIMEGLRPKGYGLVMSSSDEDPELELKEIEQQTARRVDALILASTQHDGKFPQSLVKQDVPLVLLDRFFPGHKNNFVGTSDEEIGVAATRHLIERGCRRLAHIRGPDMSTGIGRLKGFQRAVAELGVSPDVHLIVKGKTADDSGEEIGYKAMKRLLEGNLRPDGVFCYNDPVAVGAMDALFDAGLRVPQDVAIIGAGNARWARLLRVPLSSVDQNAGELGRRAAKLALKVIESKQPGRVRSILLQPTVVARMSTARNGSENARLGLPPS